MDDQGNHDIFTSTYINELLSLFNPLYFIPNPSTNVSIPVNPSTPTKCEYFFGQRANPPQSISLPLRYLVCLRPPFLANRRRARPSRDAVNRSGYEIQTISNRRLGNQQFQTQCIPALPSGTSTANLGQENTKPVHSLGKSKHSGIERDARELLVLNQLRPSVIRRSFSSSDKHSTLRVAVCTIQPTSKRYNEGSRTSPSTTDKRHKSLESPLTSPVSPPVANSNAAAIFTRKRKAPGVFNNHRPKSTWTTDKPKKSPRSPQLPIESPQLSMESPVLPSIPKSAEKYSGNVDGPTSTCTTNEPSTSSESSLSSLESQTEVRSKRKGVDAGALNNDEEAKNSKETNNKDEGLSSTEGSCSLGVEEMASTEGGEKKPTSKPKKKCKFTCSFCQKGFKWFSHWQAHERVHTGERPYKCDVCPRSFKRADGLHCHRVIHSKERITQCTYCSKKFNKKYGLEKHLFEHTGLKPFVCDYCNVKVMDTERIEGHLVKHKEKKRFTCQYCELVFINAKRLVKHIRGHTGEKPFKCRLCSLSFSKKSALNIHHRVHSGLRPYSCSQCEKTFTIKGNLLRHQLIHTGERPYECEHCTKSYNNPSHLSRHRTTHHGV